jgi:hypothetical protein
VLHVERRRRSRTQGAVEFKESAVRVRVEHEIASESARVT